MNSVTALLKNRWFWLVTGVLALGVVIWWVGPLIAVGGAAPLATESGRWIAIAVTGSSLFLYRAVSYYETMRNNRRMLGDLAGGVMGGGSGAAAGGAAGAAGGAPAQEQREAAKAEEAAVLEEKFNKAVVLLRKAKLGGAKQPRSYLYQLPWYIIIGPPGAGKTTALLNSGLTFPLAKSLGQSHVQGIAGTRHCDWWFTDEAVFLDTAGRYTTQDSQPEVDQAAWHSFLGLLKKHRRRRPINGVLIAIGLADLLNASETERAAQVQAIRDRLQELHEKLGIRFPVYVLFTKADLLVGFVEFFNDLGQVEREQVWGMTFPLDEADDPAGVIAHFPEERLLLDQRLNDRLIERLQNEQDPAKRTLIYLFPQQFSAMEQVLDRFLKAIFQPTRFTERTLLRGVYFTSATQVGTPMDRLVRRLAATFGVNRLMPKAFSGKGRSFFLTRLLREVVFVEAELAGVNLRWERWRAWIQRGAYATAAVLIVTIASLWVVSYARNHHYVSTLAKQHSVLETQVNNLLPTQHDLAATLPLLHTARHLPPGYPPPDRPLFNGFGLYQGDKLGSQAVALYRRLLERALFPRLMVRLEQYLQQKDLTPAELHEALKVYLMLDASQHFDAKVIKAWVLRDAERLQLGTDQQRQLGEHIEALFERGALEPPFRLDRGLIEHVRLRLRQVPLAERLYEQLKQHFANSPALQETIPTVRFLELAGPDAPRVFTRRDKKPLETTLSGLYTKAGYQQFFATYSRQSIDNLAADQWVLGGQVTLDAPQQQRLMTHLCRLYLTDYSRQWQQLLDVLTFQPVGLAASAVEQAKVLSGSESPLSYLIAAVVEHTTLKRDPKPEAPPSPASDKADKVAQDAPPEPVLPCTLTEFESPFLAWHRTAKGVAGAIPPIDKILALISELYGHLHAAVRAEAENVPVEAAVKEKLAEVAGRLEIEASRQPKPLNEWLTTFAQDSANSVRTLRERLNSLWQAVQAPAHYQTRLKGHYPLSRLSIQAAGPTTAALSIEWSDRQQGALLTQRQPPDSALESFGEFFGVGGILDQFFQQHLRPFVDTSQATWYWRGPDNPERRISPEALQAFQYAATIRAALFSDGSRKPLVPFELTVIEPDFVVEQLQLNVEGQLLNYQRGQPLASQRMRWPGATQGVVLRLVTSRGEPQEIREEGVWAWFKMIDRAQIRTPSPGHFELSWQLGPHRLRYDLRTQTASNPFRLLELERFQCPATL